MAQTATKYPSNYRPGPNRAPGFQRGAPVPANDNFRLPSPANDNVPSMPKLPRAPMGGGNLLRRTAGLGLRRVLPRLVPGLGLALTLYELYQWYKGLIGRNAGFDTTGFHQINDCGGPGTIMLRMEQRYDCDARIDTGFDSLNSVRAEAGDSGFGLFYLYYEAHGTHLYKKSTGWERDVGYDQPSDPVFHEATQSRPPIWADVGPSGQPWSLSPILPDYFPALDPDSLPIGQPAPSPQPVPYPMIPDRVSNPYRINQPDRGNTAPEAGPVTAPEPEAPGAVIITPHGNTTTRVKHQYKRPKPREKERKLRVPTDRLFFQVLSQLTEYNDYIAALYKALPNKYQVRFVLPSGDHIQRKNGQWAVDYNPTPQAKAKALYDAFDKLSDEELQDFVTDGFNNLLTNEIQDRIIGYISRGAGGLRRSEYVHNKVGGFQVGPAL